MWAVEMSQQSSITTGSRADTESRLPVVAKAVWLVMKKRDYQNYGRVLDFVEITHEQVPGLLCYRHHAKLSTGLRGKMVLNMIKDKRPLLEILKALNRHFPPVFTDDSTASQRDLVRVRQCKMHFRKLVLRMIRDEKFRQHYVAFYWKEFCHLQDERRYYTTTALDAEYGENFMAVLEKLLWEFLYRLQTVLNHQVPETTEPPMVEEESVSSPPNSPDSGLNISNTPGVIFTEKRSVMKQNRESPLTSAEDEELPNVLQARPEMQPNCPERDQDRGNCEGRWDREQNVSQAGSLEERSFPRRTLDPVRSLHSGEGTADCNLGEHWPPFFDIFGFDSSQSSKVNNCRTLSPPDPLQSQESERYLDSHRRHDGTGSGSTVSLSKRRVRTEGATCESHRPIFVHEQQDPVSRASDKEQSAGGEPLSQGLMSWRYQPRVHLTPLPMKVISKYVGQEQTQVESVQDDLTPQAAESELSQSTTYTDLGSWLLDCSGPTDNDSNDPDYKPGHSFFHYFGQQNSVIRPKRTLHFSSRS